MVHTGKLQLSNRKRCRRQLVRLRQSCTQVLLTKMSETQKTLTSEPTITLLLKNEINEQLAAH